MNAGLNSISVARQCQLLGLAKSSYYYQPIGESKENLLYMRLIDEQYTKTPFYGEPLMTVWLRSQGYWVNEKRVCRLMKKMELKAVVPKKRTSKPGQVTKKYPYLLNDLEIKRPNQVWSTAEMARFPRLYRRHHLHQARLWLCLSVCHSRLVQPICAGVGNQQLGGCLLLLENLGQSPATSKTRHLQQRSGKPVYITSFHLAP